jgi:hypothetical protein
MPIGLSVFGRAESRRAITAFSLAIAIAVLVAGCSGGGDDADTTPEATPMPTAEPTPTPEMRLGPVTWTTAIDESGAPTEELTGFPRDTEVIYAVVNVTSVVSGETLTANWSLDDVPIDAIETTVTIDQSTDAGWASFALTWEGEALWPVGTLQVTISGSSGASTTGTIVIEST